MEKEPAETISKKEAILIVAEEKRKKREPVDSPARSKTSTPARTPVSQEVLIVRLKKFKMENEIAMLTAGNVGSLFSSLLSKVK